MEKIIGRNHERRILEKLYKSTKAEFLAVYGRRRIGKTFLIHQFFKDKGIYFEITGSKNASKEEQLANFYREFIALFKSVGEYTAPKNWSEALHQLHITISKIPVSQKIILFFDELPWLSSPKSGFLQALEYLWNRHLSRMPNVLLIVCGSAASWMIKKIIHNHGGLYGRLSAEIRLQPFSLSEVEEFLRSHLIELTRKQITEVYMVTGGVPKYLSYIERGKSSAQIINTLCFTPQSPLLKEFHLLFDSLFEDAHKHVKIVQELGKKRNGMTQKELLKAVEMPPGGRTSDILEELEASGFIYSTQAFGKQKREKKYHLIDEYSLFYLTWVDRDKLNILQGNDQDYWNKIHMTPKWFTWAGYAFENICLRHASKIKEGLSIAGVHSRESHWQYIPPKKTKEIGAQIDLVIDRADQCINLCEIKFYNMLYAMTKKDASDFERKKNIFREKTKTRKAIFLTLITPFGAIENEFYLSSVENQLTLDSLF